MRMKHRWIGGLLLAAVLTLSACAPGSGASSDAPSDAAAESTAPEPDASAEPMESHAPDRSDDSDDPYDY